MLVETELTIPPAKLFTSTGTLVKTTVLVVTKMNDTDEILIKEVGRTLSQLSKSVCDVQM